MKCGHFKEKLSLLIDNQLDADEAVSIKKHLDECDSCRAYYGNLLKLEQMTNDFDLGENSKYWELQREKVLEKIDEAETEKIFGLKARRRRNRYYKFMAVAASLALVAIVSIYESKEIKQTRGLFDDKAAPQAPEQIIKSESESHELAEPGGSKVDSAEIALNESFPAVESETHPPAVDDKPADFKKNIAERAASVVADNKAKIDSVEAMAEPSSMELGGVSDASGRSELSQIVEPDNISFQADKIEPVSLKPSPDTIESSLDKAGTGESKLRTPLKSQNVTKKTVEDMATSRKSEDASIMRAEFSGEKSPEEDGKNVWQIRLDSLEVKYTDIYSPHYIESSAKREMSIPRDSLDTIILEIAAACFQVGILTQDIDERELMMSKLRRLADNGGPEAVEKIQNYIALLLSAD